jgi:PhzF family phenazine biosynthesis protein
MMNLSMMQIDAFASGVFAGNPAAVLVMDRALDERTMLAIAEENNLAETAFCVRRDGESADYDLRWFTPVHEAAFCGHATLATAHALVSEHKVAGEITFHTRKVGTLRVTSAGHDEYTLSMPRFDPQPLTPLPHVFTSLFPEGADQVFQNFENLFVELADERSVRAYKPDHLRIATLDPFGLVITARADAHMESGIDFVSRYFCPAAGIPEDPVTGSTHATLAPYWASRLGRDSIVGYQASKRGGRLVCKVTSDRVYLTGHAVTYMRAEINVPTKSP